MALLGDAAHLATPMFAQGTSQAIEDALELGRWVVISKFYSILLFCAKGAGQTIEETLELGRCVLVCCLIHVFC